MKNECFKHNLVAHDCADLAGVITGAIHRKTCRKVFLPFGIAMITSAALAIIWPVAFPALVLGTVIETWARKGEENDQA